MPAPAGTSGACHTAQKGRTRRHTGSPGWSPDTQCARAGSPDTPAHTGWAARPPPRRARRESPGRTAPGWAALPPPASARRPATPTAWARCVRPRRRGYNPPADFPPKPPPRYSSPPGRPELHMRPAAQPLQRRQDAAFPECSTNSTKTAPHPAPRPKCGPARPAPAH